MKRIDLKAELPDEEADKLGGKWLDETHYDTILNEDADVFKPDGSPLLMLRKGVLPAKLIQETYPIWKEAAALTLNRGMAAGEVDPAKTNLPVGEQSEGSVRFRHKRKDGAVSNTTIANPVKSGIVGYFDRSARNPYCRLTAYPLANPEKWETCWPFIKAVDEVFRRNSPERHAAQMEIVRRTSEDFVIHGTAFTTVTVNRNFRTAIHKDAGDFAAGFGVMCGIRAGHYEGGFTCFPKFRVGVNLESGDVLLADVHEWHGNSPIIGRPGTYERISLVFYYRERMAECGSAEEELARLREKQTIGDE